MVIESNKSILIDIIEITKFLFHRLQLSLTLSTQPITIMPPKGKKKGKKKGKQSGPAKQEPGVPTDREELLQKEYVCRCSAYLASIDKLVKTG